MIIHAGDIVINRETGNRHQVTEVETKVLGCGCKITKRIKLDGGNLWFDPRCFRLFEEEDF